MVAVAVAELSIGATISELDAAYASKRAELINALADAEADAERIRQPLLFGGGTALVEAVALILSEVCGS